MTDSIHFNQRCQCHRHRETKPTSSADTRIRLRKRDHAQRDPGRRLESGPGADAHSACFGGVVVVGWEGEWEWESESDEYGYVTGDSDGAGIVCDGQDRLTAGWITGEDTDAGIENYQEALRLFPPFRDDDGYTFGAVEVPCPDCDAVFSSAYVSSCARTAWKGCNVNECRTELEQHYLTRYCPGSAVAVYVMTRDRYVSLYLVILGDESVLTMAD